MPEQTQTSPLMVTTAARPPAKKSTPVRRNQALYGLGSGSVRVSAMKVGSPADFLVSFAAAPSLPATVMGFQWAVPPLMSEEGSTYSPAPFGFSTAWACGTTMDFGPVRIRT